MRLTYGKGEDEGERCQRREHETAIHVVCRTVVAIRAQPMAGELSFPLLHSCRCRRRASFFREIEWKTEVPPGRHRKNVNRRDEDTIKDLLPLPLRHDEERFTYLASDCVAV